MLFISYSHEDETFVNQLVASLLEHRVSIWYDRIGIKVGESLLEKIQGAIAEADFLAVVLSKASIQSAWCREELNAAIMRQLAERRAIVLPLLIEDCNIPLVLRDKKYADFRTDFERGFQELRESIAASADLTLGRKDGDRHRKGRERYRGKPIQRPKNIGSDVPAGPESNLDHINSGGNVTVVQVPVNMVSAAMERFSSKLGLTHLIIALVFLFLVVVVCWIRSSGRLQYYLSTGTAVLLLCAIWIRTRNTWRQRIVYVVGSSAFGTLVLLTAPYMAPVRVAHLQLTAKFVAWDSVPADTSRLPREVIRKSLSPAEDETIPFFQKAVYEWGYELRPHVGGRLVCRYSTNIGRVDVLLLAPTRDHVVEERFGRDIMEDGKIRQYFVHEISCWGVDRIKVESKHYNGFSLNHHPYGFPIHFPSDRVSVRFDFSGLDREAVFDKDFEPKIRYQEFPYQPVSDARDITDRSEWNRGVLKAELLDVPVGAAVLLDCVWFKPESD